MSSDEIDYFNEFLDHFRDATKADPGQPTAQFGHIVMPPNREEGRSFVNEVLAEFPVNRTVSRVFIVGADEPPVPEEPPVGGLTPESFSYTDFLAVLRKNILPNALKPDWAFSFNPDPWHEDQILPLDALVLMQLDLDVSVECALALTLAVNWAICVSRRKKPTRIRVVTLSPRKDVGFIQSLGKAFGAHLHVPSYDGSLYWDQDLMELVELSNADTPESITEELVSVISQRKKASRFILSFDETLVTRLDYLLTNEEASTVVRYFANPESYEPLQDISSLGREGGTTLLTVSGQPHVRPIAIQGYDEVHVVLGYTDRTTPAWDNTTRQVLVYPHKTSRQHRDLQMWWAYHPDRPVKLYSGQDTPRGFLENGGESVRLVEGAHLGAFISLVVDLSRYCIPTAKVIDSFIRYRLIAKDMMDMLSIQGLVSNNGLGLTSNEVEIFRGMLPLVRHDHRLAMLLALDSTPTVRRTKAQFAAVLVSPKFCRLDDYDRLRSPAVETVFRNCRGFGRSLARQGSTWLTLGLAKYFIDYETQMSQGTNALSGIIKFTEEGIDRLKGSINGILRLFASLGAPVSLSDVSSEHKDLTEFEKWQLHNQIFRAYLAQVSVYRSTSTASQGESKPVCTLYRSMDRCNPVATDVWPIRLIDCQALMKVSQNNLMVGITHRLTRCSSGIEMEDWVMIPADVVVHWQHENGISLHNALVSGIQHEESNSIEVDGGE